MKTNQFATFTPVTEDINVDPQSINQYYSANGITPDNEYMTKYITQSQTSPTTNYTPESFNYENFMEQYFPAAEPNNNSTPIDNYSMLTTNSGEKIDISKGETGNAKRAINYLIKSGLSKEQATAIAANLHIESRFNTTVEGDTNLGKGQEAVGIAQWRLDRKNNMFNFLKNKGLPASSFEGQLSFLIYELKSGTDGSGGMAWQSMQGSKDVGVLAANFDKYYERSDGKARRIRSSLAKQLYNS